MGYKITVSREDLKDIVKNGKKFDMGVRAVPSEAFYEHLINLAEHIQNKDKKNS